MTYSECKRRQEAGTGCKGECYLLGNSHVDINIWSVMALNCSGDKNARTDMGMALKYGIESLPFWKQMSKSEQNILTDWWDTNDWQHIR